MAESGVDVNTSVQNGYAEITGREKLTEKQTSSESHPESLESPTDLKEVPWACVRVEEPDGHARRYLEENQILRILETLLTKLVYQKPDKPLEFLAKEMEMMKEDKLQNNTNPGRIPNSGILQNCQVTDTEHGNS